MQYLLEQKKDIKNIPTHPCRLVVIDPLFQDALSNACKNLVHDRLNIEIDSKLERDQTEKIHVAPSTGIGKAVEVVRNAMKEVNHALYHGHIYKKA